MNEAQRKVLKNNHGDILKNLILDTDILSSLLQRDVLTETMVQNIQAKHTQHEKIIDLLFILPRRGPKAFPVFLDAVKKHSQFLSDKLQQDYEKEYKIMKEQEAAMPQPLPQKQRSQSESESIDQQKDHSKKQSSSASSERNDHKSPTKSHEDAIPARRMSVISTTTHHMLLSNAAQQNFNHVYTRLKTKLNTLKHGEPSFTSPEPATFKMVDKLLDDVFQVLDDHEMAFSQCHALLGGKDRNYPLVSHIINMQKARRELEQDLKTKEQQKNKYADHISKLENRCRNQATEINHLNEEVKKLKEEIEKLRQLNSEKDEKQKIIDELRKMVMDADTTKKSKLRSSYLALHYDGNVSEIKQLRSEVRNLKIENQSLVTENLMLKKSENLKKLQKLREDTHAPKSEVSQGNNNNNSNNNSSNSSGSRNNHQSYDDARDGHKPRSRHVYAQSLQNMQAQSRGANSKWGESSDKASYLMQKSVEKTARGSTEHLAITEVDEKPKLGQARERDPKDPQDLDFRFANSQNGLYGQKRSPSKERSNKKVTFCGDEVGSVSRDSKDKFGKIAIGEDEDDYGTDDESTKKASSFTNNQYRYVKTEKTDKTSSRSRPPRQKILKTKTTNKRSASLNNISGSKDLVKVSSQLISKTYAKVTK